MKVMVIGGSGLFGRKTVYHMLQDKEIEGVTSMDLAPPQEWFMKLIDSYKAKFSFIRGNVSQLEDILNAMKVYPVEGVTHS